VGTTSSRSAGALLALSLAVAAAPARAFNDPPVTAARTTTSKLVLFPTAFDDKDLAPLAASLDEALADAVRDLGLSPISPQATRTSMRDAMAVHVSLDPVSPGVVLLRMRVGDGEHEERVAQGDVVVRAVALLRDLTRAAPLPPPPTPLPTAGKTLSGRITLMATSAAFGALVGFSIQKASGSNDPRLLVPLTVAGAGIGLGASYLASGEWEVGPADAWYFAAGTWWPTAAGHLLFQGRFAATRQDRDRWVFGLLGGGVGGTLSILGLALHPMSDAGAIVANAGGAGGLGLGGLIELAVRHSAKEAPYSGMGYGAALGWLAGAAVALHLKPKRPTDRPSGGSGPCLGVIGETFLGARRLPVIGVGYTGPFPL
jgi:hypothetical protein